ncbi:MerR family transcriptional regulator [Azonexus sp.]|uniref:MerR family transcriptional regulator n=1 Tax=Azonexus sp. TaxID=1872668 RepID=UPI0039E56DDD
MPASPALCTISDLARDFSITPRTIRFWEDHGILAPQRESGKRVFSRRDRARLKMALRGKRLGLSLAEIKDLIGMYNSTEDETPQLIECMRIMEKRRLALVQQREDIEAMLAEIAQFEAQCRQEVRRREVIAERGQN